MKKRILAIIICLILTLGGGGVVGYFLYPIISPISIEDNNKQDDETYAEIVDMIDQLEEQVNQYKKSDAEKTARLEECQNQLAKVEEQKNILETENRNYLSQIEQMTAERQELAERLDVIEDKHSEDYIHVSNQIESIDTEISNLEENVEANSQSITNLTTSQNQLSNEVGAIKTEIAEIQTSISQLSTQIADLYNLLKNYNGSIGVIPAGNSATVLLSDYLTSNSSAVVLISESGWSSITIFYGTHSGATESATLSANGIIVRRYYDRYIITNLGSTTATINITGSVYIGSSNRLYIHLLNRG